MSWFHMIDSLYMIRLSIQYRSVDFWLITCVYSCVSQKWFYNELHCLERDIDDVAWRAINVIVTIILFIALSCVDWNIRECRSNTSASTSSAWMRKDPQFFEIRESGCFCAVVNKVLVTVVEHEMRDSNERFEWKMGSRESLSDKHGCRLNQWALCRILSFCSSR